MKLNDIKPTVETSGQMEEQFFSIQDQGMIFDILRNKMYSNPISAICREISCNARDAHREVGKFEEPIIITLPNALDPFFRIKDFGPGISPDRMSNIFIKYTASTKRDDNIQTGGFGLGAKTPFSYSDTFTIQTCYNGKQYNYACFIDETKIGKLTLLSVEDTDSPNSTEIIIPVKVIDFNNFKTFTELATRCWDVKPIIKGNTIDYTVYKALMEGNGWKIISTTQQNWQRNIKAIIDGIEYPIDPATIKTFADISLFDICNGSFHLFFEIGELSLSANREQIYFDKLTQSKIKDKLNNMQLDIKKIASDKIANASSYWEANVLFSSLLSGVFYNTSFLGKLYWNNFHIIGSSINCNYDVYFFYKDKRRNSEIIRRRTTYNYISFTSASILFINDLSIKEPTLRHVKKAFEADPELLSVQVLCPKDQADLDTLNNKIYLDKWANKLSTITKDTRIYKTNKARLLVYKFSGSNFRHVAYSSIEGDKNKKVLCFIDNDRGSDRFVKVGKNKNINSETMNNIVGMHPGYSFYAVNSDTSSDRIKEDLDGFIDFELLMKEFFENCKNNFVEIRYFINNKYVANQKFVENEDKFLKSIKKKDCLFLKRLRLHKLLLSKAELDNVLYLYETLNKEISKNDIIKYIQDNPDNDVDRIESEYTAKYPLLPNVNHYHYYRITDHIAQYVNLIEGV